MRWLFNENENKNEKFNDYENWLIAIIMELNRGIRFFSCSI